MVEHLPSKHKPRIGKKKKKERKKVLVTQFFHYSDAVSDILFLHWVESFAVY
jgi:hypothetical protein